MTMKREFPPARQRLREWLRQGDPLSEGLPREDEMRKWRARVLLAAASRQPARVQLHTWMSSRVALMAGGAALLALAVFCAIWMSGPRTPTTKQVSLDPIAFSPVSSRPSMTEQTGRPPAATNQVAVRGAARPRAASQPSRASVTEGTPDRRPLQVQFITPGGTRIVWVLNPDLSLQ